MKKYQPEPITPANFGFKDMYAAHVALNGGSITTRSVTNNSQSLSVSHDGDERTAVTEDSEIKTDQLFDNMFKNPVSGSGAGPHVELNKGGGTAGVFSASFPRHGQPPYRLDALKNTSSPSHRRNSSSSPHRNSEKGVDGKQGAVTNVVASAASQSDRKNLGKYLSGPSSMTDSISDDPVN